MKLIRKLFVSLIVLIVIVGGVFFGGVLYINKKYNIDTFKTISSMKKMMTPVEESTLVTKPYSDSDMDDVLAGFDLSLDDDFITKDENGNYNIDTEKAHATMKNEILLTDTQLAAFGNEILHEKINDQIEFSNIIFPVKLLQLEFSDIQEKQTSISVVIRLDMTNFKTKFNGLILKIFKKYIPDFFYLTLPFDTVHGDTNFSYEITPKSLSINALSTEDSASLFETIGKFVPFPTSDSFSNTFGQIFMDNLIGTEENPGIVYNMKKYGAKDYSFRSQDNKSYFVIEC